MKKPTTKQSPIKATTQSFIEIEEIQDDIVLMRDFSAVTVLEVGAVNFWLLSEDEQTSIIQSYANLLNSLSFPVQILIVSKKMDISSYLEHIDLKLKAQSDPALQQRLTKYRDYIKSTVKKTSVLEKRFFFVIPFSPLEMGVGGANTRGLKKEYVITRAKTALYPKRDNMVRLLSKIGLKATPVLKQGLTEIYYNLYNSSSNGKRLGGVDNYTEMITTVKSSK